MNGSDSLARLEAADPALLAKRNAHDAAELDVLRRFFRLWETLHELPNDKMHRKQKEETAQALVNQRDVLRRMNVGPRH